MCKDATTNRLQIEGGLIKDEAAFMEMSLFTASRQRKSGARAQWCNNLEASLN